MNQDLADVIMHPTWPAEVETAPKRLGKPRRGASADWTDIFPSGRWGLWFGGLTNNLPAWTAARHILVVFTSLANLGIWIGSTRLRRAA